MVFQLMYGRPDSIHSLLVLLGNRFYTKVPILRLAIKISKQTFGLKCNVWIVKKLVWDRPKRALNF